MVGYGKREDYILYCNTELFLNKQKDHQVYQFSKI